MIDVAPVLADVCFLRGLDEQTLASFAALGNARTFPRGNVLYHYGDPCHTLYVVLTGRVKLSIIGEDGREVSLDVQNPGDVCGLVASVDDGPHVGTTMTMARSRLLAVPTPHFRAWLAEHPQAQQALMLELAGRLRRTYARIGSHVLLPVKERLRSLLYEMARAEGVDNGSHELVLERPTHQDLAERVGSTREVVTRALKALLEDQDFEVEGRVLRVRITAAEE